VSFLIDPPLLVASGAAYGKAEGPRPRAAAAATIALFWSVGVALYRERRWGREFMINSGVLRIPYDPEATRTHLAAAAAFATYPLWLLLGWKLARG